MYASVHTDRSGRVLVSDDHRASGFDGATDVILTDAIPLPDGARLVPLEREATAFGRDGRMRAIGRGRLALSAVLPAGHTRTLFPSYSDDRAAATLEPLPYTALGADARGELVVAAVRHAAPEGPPAADPPRRDMADALRALPANRLMRQLARCAKENECRAAAAAMAEDGELPVPLGAPAAERSRLAVAMRSGYPGVPREPASIHPTASDVGEAAARDRDGPLRVAFGRACDGEPLLALRVFEEALSLLREHRSSAVLHLETTGCDPAALRRALDAGLSSVTIRFASARPDTYRAVHGPASHAWSDVRASIHIAVERGIAVTLALLVLPGVTDRPAEVDALASLLGEMPGGTLELRDLGADPVRALAALPRGRPLGVRALLERLGEADHFRLIATAGSTRPEPAAASRATRSSTGPFR